MKIFFKGLLCFFVITLFGGCAYKQSDDFVKSATQSESASDIRYLLEDIDAFVEMYRIKLNKRNPKNFDPKLKDIISSQIYFKMQVEPVFQNSYMDCLKFAFDDKKPVQYRNDMLIVGIQKAIYDAYRRDKTHIWTALQYDKKKLEDLYKLLQVVQWKIKTKKDQKGNYLFLTWQNNWQVELKKRVARGEKPSWETIKNLKYIKNKKESIYDPSNESFSNVMANIIYIVGKTVKACGGEPTTLSVEAMKQIAWSIFL